MKLTVIDGEFTLKLDSYEDRKLLELIAKAYGRSKAELDLLQGIDPGSFSLTRLSAYLRACFLGL